MVVGAAFVGALAGVAVGLAVGGFWIGVAAAVAAFLPGLPLAKRSRPAFAARALAKHEGQVAALFSPAA